MTDKPEFTRNDVAAIKFLGKIFDRWELDKAAHEKRCQEAISHYQNMSLQYVNMSQTSQSLSQVAAQANRLHALQMLAQTQNPNAYTLGSPSISVPRWEPYLTQSEYETLLAWRNGEEIILHVLAEER